MPLGFDGLVERLLYDVALAGTGGWSLAYAVDLLSIQFGKNNVPRYVKDVPLTQQ